MKNFWYVVLVLGLFFGSWLGFEAGKRSSNDAPSAALEKEISTLKKEGYWAPAEALATQANAEYLKAYERYSRRIAERDAHYQKTGYMWLVIIKQPERPQETLDFARQLKKEAVLQSFGY